MATIALIGLDGEHVALVDDDVLPIVETYGQWYVRPRRRTFYAQANTRRNGKRTSVYLHRVIMGLDGPITDHINGNGLDCQRSNLRSATHAQNQANARTRTGRLFKGVSFTKGGWQVRVAGRYIGRFKSADEAASAYNNEALKVFGPYAKLNLGIDD